MNARRYSLIGSVILLILLTGCGSSETKATQLKGTRLAFGQGEVYYEDGVDPSQARKVGELIAKRKPFEGQRATIQVQRHGPRYWLRCVVRPDAERDTPYRAWRELGEAVSKECFHGAPVDLELCDDKMNVLRLVPYSPILPDLPIQVTFRPSVGGGSLVAKYRNTSAKYLAVAVKLTNPTHSQVLDITLSIPPNQTVEHGWAEGWKYVSGEWIQIDHAGYEQLLLTVP